MVVAAYQIWFNPLMISSTERVFAICWLTAVVIWLSGAIAADPALVAGQESSVTLPGSNGTMKVFLPSNYAADRKWPAIFFYHGMGGTPDTAAIRKFTDGRDYIVVGMPYLEDDHARTQQEMDAYMRRELANFQVARNWLLAHASVDDSNVYMGGASKGGWTTVTIGEMALPQLAGMVVLIAGRNSMPGKPAVVQGLQGKSIYVGAGETDPNLVPALRAREFYRKNGAAVTFEEYPGRGHELPVEATKLRAWLQVHARPRQTAVPEAVRKEWTSAVDAEAKTAAAVADPVLKYEHLKDLAEDPRLSLCEKPVADQVKTQLAAVVKASPGKEEWDAEVRFSEAIYREATIQRLSDMQAAVEGLRGVVQTYPATHFGRIAAKYLPKLDEAYKKSMDATAKANAGKAAAAPPDTATKVKPGFPIDGISRDQPPGMPVRKGNTITFKQPGEK
ncbi:MAG: hypothetical protein C0404_14165 [Verrucomicrobia bacterium]|nr:hypothetical protein [Verrucomicrobiota bacterium]